jgi:2-methylcitrate dehydratase PrpD
MDVTERAATAAQTLAAFAANLKFESIPASAVERAKDCILDTVAVSTYGSRFPWSKAVIDYAERYGKGGRCSVLGRPDLRVTAPAAALANGSLSHAFEQDSLRYPGAGVHPGATLFPPALALAQEEGADGKALLTAFVAGCEIMFRIGLASRHSSEALGFHAPGLTGPYGAAVVAGKLLKLNAEQMAYAIGIAGSLGGGLLAFTKSQTGSAVKRLHMGRASEAGVLAARLAQSGFAGPETILEGKFGFLEAYCREGNPARLTEALGERWETETICLKRYPCHITAHTPVQAVRELMAEHGFMGADVAAVTIAGSDKLLSHHNIPAPRDIMQAQYSTPFCTALALYRDPVDPNSWTDSALADSGIRAACQAITLTVAKPALGSNWATRVELKLKDGRSFTREANTYQGMPSNPLPRAGLKEKFMLMTGGTGGALWDKLEKVETARDLAWS